MAPDDHATKSKTSPDNKNNAKAPHHNNSLPKNGHAPRRRSSSPGDPPPNHQTTTTTAVTTTSTSKPTGDKQRHESGVSNASAESYEYYIPSPPDGGWGWVIVVASLFCNIIVDGLGYSFGVFLLEFADYFQESKSKVSLVGSLLCGVYLFAGPVVSALTNKFGCRPVAVAGSVVASLAFLLSTMAPSVDILILTYGVMGGFGLGMIYLPSIVSVGYYFEKKRALATGIAVCGSGIGTFIFAPLSEYLLQELDWKNALMLISGITLNGAVCGMLMRPLEPGRPKHRPRAKNLLDRIKEQAKGNRNRTLSDNSTYACSVHDTNAVLERVMEAKLQREKRLQEDDSELGSLPSIFLVRQLSHKDSPAAGTGGRDLRIHKLSLSDRGEVSSHMDSPLGSTPRISSLAPTSLPILAEASGSKTSGGGGGEAEASSKVPHPMETSPHSVTGSKAEDSSGHEAEKSSGYGTAEASTSTEGKPSSPARGGEGARECPLKEEDDTQDALSASDTFVDAESGTIGDGTNTERSGDFVTPPTSPPDTCSPSTPERREGEEGVVTRRGLLGSPSTAIPTITTTTTSSAAKNGFVQRKSDPAVTKLLTQSVKELKNGSVPSNIHHHVHEVVPLLQVPDRKTTLVNLGSEKNIWRLKNVKTPVAGQSLLSLSVSKKDLARPLYRKDIFYSGSVHNLPLFRSQPDMKSYITSITTIPGETAIVAGGEAKVWSYLCFPQSCRDILQEMLDLSLLKDTGFLLICFGNILAFLGFYVPFVYCVDLAVSLGIDKSRAAFLISIIGITNTLGRVVTGWLADLRRINSLVITYVSIFVCGLATALFPFCTSYPLLCAVASLFGLSVAAFISLSSILICDLLGLEKLTNGFGLMSLFRGMAAMAGPPLAGYVYDQTLSYDASYYLGGALLTAGAMCHLALRLPCVHKQEPEVFVEAVSVDELPVPGSGSGVKPELVTLEEVMTSV
ncbi:uncharacterized protein LOC143291736 [Babylonia areolata]|uniref:uncharacterized protein LOC143291736 n=1 Tax=Babylonia areolata TaxID=304850 RepID=UPI003FCFFC1A